MKCAIALMIAVMSPTGPILAQSSVAATESDSRVFFPHNFIRGYLGFELAPPHNEPDLGLCAPLGAGVQHSTCTAYARYVWTGYIEFQPIGRGFLRNVYLFTDPRMFFGSNLPRFSYTASHAPIAWERVVGLAIQLPKRFEIRATHHDVQMLGKYRLPSSAATQGTNGPLGLYTTVGVRWYFGSYGRSGIHE